MAEVEWERAAVLIWTAKLLAASALGLDLVVHSFFSASLPPLQVKHRVIQRPRVTSLCMYLYLYILYIIYIIWLVIAFQT